MIQNKTERKVKSEPNSTKIVKCQGLAFVLLIFTIACLFSTGCVSSNGGNQTTQSAISFTDGYGNLITLDHPASRVVSLNSDATEMMVALKASDKIVGVTDTTLKNVQINPFLTNATSVGTWDAPNVERILALKPDAIITYSSYRLKNADQFERAGIQMIALDCNKLSTITSDAKSMGKLIGNEKEAEKYIDFTNGQVTSVKKLTENLNGTRVYVEGYSTYSAQGATSSIGDMVKTANGINIAGVQDKTYMKVTPEWVIKENPDVILKVSPDPLPEGKTLQDYQSELLSRTALSGVSAVKNGKVYALSGKLVLGPRAPAGLSYVAAALHPEIVNKTDINAPLNQYATEFVSGTNVGDQIEPFP
jgi:iron complex transport system substrate-binding protein